MRIAISGAGVAGPTLAWWLRRAGHEVTLIEKAPEFRAGGYVIDFWGLGYDLAERMGVLTRVRQDGYSVREVRFVNGHGKRVSGFSTEVFERMTDGRFTSLPRGDLARAIFDAVKDEVDLIFGDSIVRIDEHADGLTLQLESGAALEADLLVGADGLHSHVRSLIMGDQGGFERDLGFRVAAFYLPDYPVRDPDIYVTRSWPGKSLARFTLRDGSALFLFVFAADKWDGPMPHDDAARRAVLREIFGDCDWEAPQVLAGMEQVQDIYFDRVSQIELPAWSKGRVALVGDAAACASLLAGEGTGLGMTEAYVLAGEITRAGDDYRAAFTEYEHKLRGFLTEKQAAARNFASSFAPGTRFGIFVRNIVMDLMGIAWVADRAVGDSLRDDFVLPDYDGMR